MGRNEKKGFQNNENLFVMFTHYYYIAKVSQGARKEKQFLMNNVCTVIIDFLLLFQMNKKRKYQIENTTQKNAFIT